MEKKILIVDSNSYLYRAAYAYGVYDSGVVTGMVRYITELLEGDSFTDAVMCWDLGKSRWRRASYPGYKKGRREKAAPLDLEAVFNQGDTVKSYFDIRGIRQIYVEGVEADDLISWISDYYKEYLGYDKVVIATSDKDLWQLLDSKTVVYDHTKSRIVNEETVIEELGLSFNRIPDLKALAGDASDNIKGVIGIGDKIAADLINKYGSLGEILDPDNAKELSKQKRTKKVIDQVGSAELSYRLVKIPKLKEARWYLSKKESRNLISRVSGGFLKPHDKLKAQIIADRLADCSLVREDMLSLAREDLTGTATFFEQGEDEKHLSLASVDSSILQCRKCELRDHCEDFGPTLPEGYEDAEIMIVGRNPSKDDLVGGRPFIGRAGERLDKFLEDVGLTRRDCWITNVNKCYSEGNRPTTVGEMKACSGYLRAEVDLIKPKFIIAFGNEAMSMMTLYGYNGIAKHCGEVLEKPRGILGEIDAWVAVCVHPSMALRSKAGELHMEYAAEQVKRFLDERR